MSSITTIAKLAGVSVGTVSSVLSGTPRLVRRDAVERAHRIRQIAADVGYRPNLAGRAVRSGRFQVAGVVTRSTITVIHHNLLKGFTWAMAEQGYHVVQAEVDPDSLGDPDAAPRLMREHCMDGMIVHFASRIPSGLRNLVEATGVPVVWVNTDAEHDAVLADDEQGGYLATSTLLERGHRRIVFGSASAHPPSVEAHPAFRERWNGYCRAMRGAGLAVRGVALALPDGEAPHEDRVRHFVQQIARHSKATAWVTVGSPGPVLLAAARLGRAVPDDLSVVGFATHGQGEEFGTQASAMVVPMLEMGRESAAMLLRKIQGNTTPTDVVRVKYRPPRPYTIGMRAMN